MSPKQAAILSALAGSLVLATGASAAPMVYPYGVTIHEEGVEEGYVIFDAPDNTIHLIDVEGTEVHSWSPTGTGNTRGPARALDNGHVLIAKGTRLLEMDWEGNVVWELIQPGGVGYHHDWERLANGNTLILGRHTINEPTISPLDIQEHFVIEVSPGGSIVWEWHPADHFEEFGFSQERLDLIYARGGNLFHFNTVAPIPENTSHTDPRFSPGNIIISLRNQNTIAIVDRVSGAIVWVLTDSTIGQHMTYMLPDDVPGGGHILAFDNGMASTWSIIPHRSHSRVVEIDPVTNSFPYVYTAESSGLPKDTFFANNMSGAQRLANGNTLIVERKWGRIFEIANSGQIVWEYISPYVNGIDNRMYRAYKVPLSWAGPHFAPDLVVSGYADPDPVEVGSELTYTIQVENVGPDPAVDVELAAATPVGTTFQSVAGPLGWDCTTPAVGATGPITCARSNLSTGSAEIVTMVVEADLCHVDGMTITHTATASSLGSDAAPGDNSTTIETTGASDALIQDLAVRLTNDRQDVELAWGDHAAECGYRVLRSTTPVAGFVDASGSLSSNSYIDPGAGSSPESYYYLIRID
jgi:uncharacterized repeat protein (TIGR01451 family)